MSGNDGNWNQDAGSGSPEWPDEQGGNGQQARQGETFCNNCGQAISAQAEICPECGVRQQGVAAESNPEPSDRLMAALIGGAVSLFGGGILPLVGHIGGGVVAGYLRGSDGKESALIGGLSSFLASIPAVGLFGLILALGLFGSIADGDAAAGAGVFVIFGGIIVLILGFYVVCGLIGGYIGAEITDRRAP